MNFIGMSFDMNVNKKILFLLTLNLVCFYTLRVVLGEHSSIGNEGESTNEYKSDVTVEELLETTEIDSERGNEVKKKIEELEKEKKKLAKLKNEFHEISEKSKQSEGNKVENEESLNNEESNTSLSVKEESEPEDKVILEDEEIEKEDEVKVIIKKKDEIANPFEIAENLYKMGGYEKALDIYNLINRKDIEFEKAAWITYQIANCYRKLGTLEKALKIYKEVQDEYGGSYWGKQAQWYIDEIKWRAGAKDKLPEVGLFRER
jgi:tetratricopeptide (TPR) repeat protein